MGIVSSLGMRQAKLPTSVLASLSDVVLRNWHCARARYITMVHLLTIYPELLTYRTGKWGS
jgi:hypothetical protein